MGTHEIDLSRCTDAELIARLRVGESEAYTELWRRHIAAALRVAHQAIPNRAEDLASESFLSVYNQIVISGNGPKSAFRAYLFTTIRNTAIRWRKSENQVDTEADLDEIDADDGLSAMLDRERAALMLDAFQALPTRWQRILWLTEIEEVSRPRIAAELGIKPNAVSALYRRARNGLRLQWLAQHVPDSLRRDSSHVAAALPEFVLDGKTTMSESIITQHLASCEACSELLQELVATSGHIKKSTLAVAGFAGLSVVLPAASQLSATAAGAAVAILVAGGMALAASLGLLAPDSTHPQSAPVNVTQSEESDTTRTDSAATGNTDAGDADASQISSESGDRSGRPTLASILGRGNTDSSIATIEVGAGEPTNFYVEPTSPKPRSTAAPQPQPIASDNPTIRAGLQPPIEPNGYIAPGLTGNTTPGNSIAIELEQLSSTRHGMADTRTYDVNVQGDGSWSFDLRPVTVNSTGEFEYRVWAYTDETSSAVEAGRFAVAPPAVTGFESIDPFDALPLAEAADTGIVFRLVGPADGTVCLSSVWTGQATEISLDSDGSATKRIRMLRGGNYFLEFRTCESDYRGPAEEILFDVYDPDASPFSNFGGASTDTVFEVIDP